MDKLDIIKKKIAEFEAKSAAKEEIKAFTTLLLSVLKTSKETFDNLTKDNLATIQQALAYLETEHSKLENNVSQLTENAKKDFEDSILEVKKLIEEVKSIEVRDGIDGADGKDADEEKIVEEVLAKIPKVEEVTGETIVDKINALSLEEENKIDAKHIKNLPKSTETRGGGTKFLQYLADVNIQTPTDGQVLTYDDTTRTWKNEAGGGGTIDGSGTTNELTYWVDSNTVGALAVATYPSLTELSYIKGLTSAVQTQLNSKQASDTQLTSLAALSYAGNALKVVRVNAGETDFELATISAGGVDTTGTPANNQVAIFTDADTLEGDANFTWDGTTLNLATGKYISLNSVRLASGITANDAYFFGNAGNTTETGVQNNAFGRNALTVIAGGTRNNAFGSYSGASITEGTDLTAMGNNSARFTTGDKNTAIGSASLQTNTTGGTNTALGYNALFTTTGSGNVGIGAFAGKYETGSNSFYVDNQDRTNTAGDKAGALLYGTFNATPASQTLVVNGTLGVSTLTASEIVITDASKNLVSASVATYPSLTELAYVKGVSSAIQTQINTKANSSGALTQFVGNGNWKVWYSDGSGDVQELALGADGTFLKSNGAASAPSFATPAGSGDVTKVGTPVNNQIGVWTGDGTIEGTANFTFDSVGKDFLIDFNGAFAGTWFNIADDYFEVSTQSAGYKFSNGSVSATLDMSSLASTSKTFTFPNTTGTIALTANPTDITVPDEAYGAGWNGSLEVPTKNALYDKIETLTGGGVTESFVIAMATAL